MLVNTSKHWPFRKKEEKKPNMGNFKSYAIAAMKNFHHTDTIDVNKLNNTDNSKM